MGADTHEVLQEALGSIVPAATHLREPSCAAGPQVCDSKRCAVVCDRARLWLARPGLRRDQRDVKTGGATEWHNAVNHGIPSPPVRWVEMGCRGVGEQFYRGTTCPSWSMASQAGQQAGKPAPKASTCPPRPGPCPQRSEHSSRRLCGARTAVSQAPAFGPHYDRKSGTGLAGT